jgi:hypothetical protein
MSEYGHVRVYLDPLGLARLPDGSYQQRLELVLSDDPDRDPPSLADPVCSLDAGRARRLAEQLLALAEHAQHPRLGSVAA